LKGVDALPELRRLDHGELRVVGKPRRGRGVDDPTGPRCLRPGDEVIVPAVTWSTTIFPLQQLGLARARGRRSETLNLTLEGVEAALTRKTRGSSRCTCSETLPDARDQAPRAGAGWP
jgi:hypothetical protein